MVANSINDYLTMVLYSSLVLLSFLFVTNALGVNKRANRLLGIFLLLWSTYWIEEILMLIHLDLISNTLAISLKWMQFLTPIIFYFSTLLYSNPDYKLAVSDLKFLVVPAIYLLGLLRFEQNLGSYPYYVIHTGLILIHALYYVYESYLRISKHKEQLRLFSSSMAAKDLQWLEYIIMSLLFLAVFIGGYNLFFGPAHLNLFANLFCCGIVFFVSFHAIRQKEIFEIRAEQRMQIIESNRSEAVERRKPLSQDELEPLMKRLTQIMETKQPYLDPDLSLLQLSEVLEITPHQLSYLINEGFQENFFTFVNKYRIEMVKALLHAPEKQRLSILGIAFESGFNSKTAFYRTFKKITSTTPSEYLKKGSTL